MAILKPLLSKIWANTASGSDLDSPDTAKYSTGWVFGEKPPNGQMNWLQWTFSKAFAHLNEVGVLEHDTTTTYPAGAFVSYQGKVYKARLSNTNQLPTITSQWQEQSLPDMPTTGNGYILYYSGSKLFWKDQGALKYGDYAGRIAGAVGTLELPYHDTIGVDPLPAELGVSDLAINFKNKSLYTKDPAGNIIKLGGSASIVDWEYTLTEGQTTVQPTGGYTVNQIEVFMGGRKLAKVDFVANDGINVVLVEAGKAGDILVISVWGSFVVADAYTQTQTDALLSAMRANNAGIGFDFYGDETALLAQKGNTAVACNNQILVRADYQELFDNIGTTYDTFNGAVAPLATEFRVPPQEVDGLGLYNRGVGAINGAVGTYQVDVFKEHRHTVGRNSSNNIGSGSYRRAVGDTGSTINTGNIGDLDETRPRSLTILKAVWTGK